MREAEKVLDGRVRTIIAMDVNHVVAHCMLALYQNLALRDSLYQSPFMIGLNLLNGGATRLCDYMTPYGWNIPCVIELDGKQFDGKCKYDPHFKNIGELRWNLLAPLYRTEENRKRLENIYRELCFSPLVNVDGHVFGRSSGNPSGQGCTTPDNSFKNWSDMYVLWCLCVPPEYANLNSFLEYVRVIIVGDDVSLAVHPYAQLWFNHKTIRDNAPRIGMEYHFAHDTFQWFKDTTFLGHGFKDCWHPSGIKVTYPTINSDKMRASLLHFNEEGTIAMTIIRTCALRNETFANERDRTWFSEVISFLRRETSDDKSDEVKLAWKTYLTDYELHELYSGISINGDILVESDGANYLETFSLRPENEFIRFVDVSLDDGFFHPPMLHNSILDRISGVSIDHKVHLVCETMLTL
jgi:hypothetical protein